VRGEIHAVGQWRRGQLVDLFAEGCDLVARLVEGREQPLILPAGVGEPPVGVVARGVSNVFIGRLPLVALKASSTVETAVRR
jgi:hypothetical protein